MFFSTGLLSKENNLMDMEKVFVTPHIASTTANESIAPQVVPISFRAIIKPQITI